VDAGQTQCTMTENVTAVVMYWEISFVCWLYCKELDAGVVTN